MLHIFTGAMMRDFAVKQSKLPASKQIKCSPVTDWISHTPLHKAPHLHRRQPTHHIHHSDFLVSDFHLLEPALPLPDAHVPRLQTITPDGCAKHLWNTPQDTHHDNKI